MVKEGYVVTEYFGGPDSLSSDYGEFFTGYHSKASDIGGTTNPQVANQIQEVTNLLNQGVVPIEMGALSMEVFDQIPKQHFKEIKRLMDMSGAKPSLHAPLVEPSGLNAQGGPYEEANRELVERQLKDVVDKAVTLSDKGSLPVTFHPTGNQMLPGKHYERGADGKKKVGQIIAINQEDGRPQTLREETLFYPVQQPDEGELSQKTLTNLSRVRRGEQISESERRDLDKELSLRPVGKGKIFKPEDRIRSLNNTSWDNSVTELRFKKEQIDEILQQWAGSARPILEGLQKKEFDANQLDPSAMNTLSHFENARSAMEDLNLNAKTIFHKAYKYGNKEQRKALTKISENYANQLKKTRGDPLGTSMAVQNLLEGLDRPELAPEIYKPIEEFARDKTAKTFANTALHAVRKHKDKAPMINIENVYPGTIFSSGEEMEKLIKASRQQFVEQAMKKTSEGGLGMSKSAAMRQAEKTIGMTLDVGHWNIGKKYGLTDKDIVEDVKKVSKYVKHVHLTDNFGYGDSHLSPGMGNVPIKEIMKEMEKAGYGGRQIVEAGGLINQFRTSPTTYNLAGLGAPIFEGGGNYWNQTEGLFTGGYSGGFGEILPSMSYQMFGAGFSQLPQELGGNAHGGAAGSRMSGRGME